MSCFPLLPGPNWTCEKCNQTQTPTQEEICSFCNHPRAVYFKCTKSDQVHVHREKKLCEDAKFVEFVFEVISSTDLNSSTNLDWNFSCNGSSSSTLVTKCPYCCVESCVRYVEILQWYDDNEKNQENQDVPTETNQKLEEFKTKELESSTSLTLASEVSLTMNSL